MKRTLSVAALLIAAAVAFTGCAAGAPAVETSASPTATKTEMPKPTPTPPPDSDGDGVIDTNDDFPADATRSEQLYYPSGAPVLAGYPLVVDSAQIDYRVSSWLKTPQAVALAPGVYAGYNPAATDLSIYLDGPADGDCAVRDMYGFSGGACWTGVLASPAEPVP